MNVNAGLHTVTINLKDSISSAENTLHFSAGVTDICKEIDEELPD